MDNLILIFIVITSKIFHSIHLPGQTVSNFGASIFSNKIENTRRSTDNEGLELQNVRSGNMLDRHLINCVFSPNNRVVSGTHPVWGKKRGINQGGSREQTWPQEDCDGGGGGGADEKEEGKNWLLQNG